MINDDNSLVLEYFRLIKEKDIDGLLDLFTDDAVIYEPFSKLGTRNEGLRNRTAIRAFFEVAVMANDGLKHNITLQEEKVNEVYAMYRSNNTNNAGKAQNRSIINALVRFEKGRSSDAKFTFEIVKCPTSDILMYNVEDKCMYETSKIRSLRIEFSNP